MRQQVWERWLAAAGPWKSWCVCPALLAPEADKVVPVPSPENGAHGLADSLRGSLEAGGALVILDLDPRLGVATAGRLNEWRLANAVLVLHRWPYRRAILPVDRVLHALIGAAPHLAPDSTLPNVAFVVDAQRARRLPTRSAVDDRADNRYRLLVSELPDLASLRARGVRRVVRVCSG